MPQADMDTGAHKNMFYNTPRKFVYVKAIL